MEEKTSLASGIEVTQENIDYDAACKRLLSEKKILAWILKSCVEEFKEYDVKTIAERCIEGKPWVSAVPVAPDETGAFLRGMNTALTSPTEGDAYFDIYFNAVVPRTGEVIQLIINVEVQADFYPGYPLLKRVVYYCARMISAQKGTVFQKSEYGKLQKVYSIWICTNPPKKRENTINRYRICEENVVGAFREPEQNYDLISMVTICLGNKDAGNYDGILKLLGTLLTSDATADEKKRVLEDEFDIPMTQEINEEVSYVGDLWRGVEERGIQKGIQRGYQNGQIADVRNLMRNTGWPFERAVSTLNIPKEQWKSYSEQLGANAP